MSGFEIIGVILGIVGIFEPLEEGFQTLRGATKSSASFHRILSRTKCNLIVQREAFLKASKKLFGDVLSTDESERLFGPMGHQDPQWQEESFDKLLRKHLGRSYEAIKAAMALIHGHFEAIAKILRKMAVV